MSDDFELRDAEITLLCATEFAEEFAGGYRLLVVRDPDGNELCFAYPNADETRAEEASH